MVRSEVAGIQPHKIIAKGNTVAITAGSRGIANLAVIIAEIVKELKKVGAKPFIIPAMGSQAVQLPKARKKFWNITESQKRPWACPLNHR